GPLRILPSGPQRSFFGAVFGGAPDQAGHGGGGGVELRRVQLAGFDDLFHFHHGDASGHGGQRVEVLRGVAVDHVAVVVGLPALDDGEVALDGAFEDVVTAVELAHFLALGDRGAVAGGGEERGNAGAAGAQFFGQGA